MNTIKLIKTSRKRTIPNIVNLIFIMCGGKLYLDYILVTNPTSKNPIIKLLYRWANESYCASNYTERYYLAIKLGVIHLIGFILYGVIDTFWSLGNILINVYPIIVQLYIGYRCYRLKTK